ncbi:MAG: 2-oxoacid:acceptor oxidoreductase subunit alpha [Candidatus Omnitrophota bacterium]
MDDFALLIGGKAGDGIDKAGSIIASLLNQLGYSIYVYRDYPSIIRGGHTFSIIRASREKKATCREKIDFLLALNQDSITFHTNKLTDNCLVIYNSDLVKVDTIPPEKKSFGIPLEKIVKEEKALDVMRNSCIIGCFAKAIGLDWNILETVFKKNISKETDLNIKLARRGYEVIKEVTKIDKCSDKILPLVTGNEAIGCGLLKAGLGAYVAYPMTPLSNLLHFLAGVADDFGIDVIHPESEIGVILMALGFAYAGKRVAVGTSGGGFCLMTESLSLAAMAELPVVIILGQRTGPSTGLPTYTAQSDLHFAYRAGHGEFSRFLVAPGDAEEAYFWAGIALNISWQYQIPSIILVDKTLCEGTFSIQIDLAGSLEEQKVPLWDAKEDTYRRYRNAENGVSPLAFVPQKDQIIKVNSYEHDEFGITTEDAQITKFMQEKRLRKKTFLLKDLEREEVVKVYANKKADTAILCWGSNKGVCIEAAQNLGLKVIQPLVLSPFPVEQFTQSLVSVKKVICVENNFSGQLAEVVKLHGFNVNERILKYDGRPFFLEELEDQLKKIL